MNFLLLISKKEVREIVSFSLESKFQATIHEAGTDADAIEKLRDLKVASAIDLVIVDYPAVGNLFFQYLSTIFVGRFQKRLPCIICSDGEIREDAVLDPQNIVGVFYQKNILASLVSVVEDYIKETSGGLTVSDSDFCRIKTELLLRVSPLKADVFIKLSDAKYLKLFHEGSNFDPADYEKYKVRKNLDYLYLKKTDLDEFLSKFKADMTVLLQTPNLSEERAREMTGVIHETVQELIQRIGPTKDVQDVIKSNVQLTVKSVGRNPRLKSLLGTMHKDPRQYISSHSVFLAHLACTIATAMEWRSDTTFYKINLAAFLHDITLRNNDLAQIRSLDELETKKSRFTPQEISEFKFHPIAAAELAKEFDEIPPDVDSIIAQHHELPDGTGFPRGLVHTRIGPLGALFIVAHDIVSEIFQKQDGFKIAHWLQANHDKYSQGNFKKIMKAIAEANL